VGGGGAAWTDKGLRVTEVGVAQGGVRVVKQGEVCLAKGHATFCSGGREEG
jgi:hypothetical protein